MTERRCVCGTCSYCKYRDRYEQRYMVVPVPPLYTRDDCPTCAAQRDEFNRLPVGLCGTSCLMARPRPELAS